MPQIPNSIILPRRTINWDNTLTPAVASNSSSSNDLAWFRLVWLGWVWFGLVWFGLLVGRQKSFSFSLPFRIAVVVKRVGGGCEKGGR
ncbi:hypothetical protein M0804_007222 [Polistes exclamans]|nr:hypothetical protein M0804_007222 [Polistes exclamans]